MKRDHTNTEEQEFRLRLQSCLQTILDLKDNLSSMPFGKYFLPEFCSLENFLNELDHITLDENSVRRVELATDKFLSELGMLIKNTSAPLAASAGILQ